jgi:hypothetical protein
MDEMQIKFETTNTIVEEAAKAAKEAVIADFKATQELQTASPEHRSTIPGHIAPPVIGKVNSPLAGSPAEVFAKAGVISITEPTRATLTFESEHAAFKNTLVMYKLDANGQFKDTQVIFPNASAMGSGGHLKDGQSAVHINLNAGDQVGFGLLPNGFSNPLSKQLLTRPDGQLGFVNWKGEPANLLTDNPNAIQLVHIDNFGNKQPISGEFGNKMFNSVGNVSQGFVTNFDGNDHADQLIDPQRGLILIGMDDLPRGAEAIRKNVLFSMDIGQNNAAALNQNLIDDKPKSFRDMSGADFMASHDEIMTTARMYDRDGDGVLNAQEWSEFAPLLNLTQDDHKHFVGLKGRGDLDSLSFMIGRGDVNGDGKIDEREVLELGRRLNGNNPNVIQSFREAAGVDWKLDYEEFISTAEHHDKNGDGLDQQEWNRFAPVLGLTPQDRNLFLKPSGQFDIGKFTSVFALADTNGSGQLDAREVLELRRIVHDNFAPTQFPGIPPLGTRPPAPPIGGFQPAPPSNGGLPATPPSNGGPPSGPPFGNAPPFNGGRQSGPPFGNAPPFNGGRQSGPPFGNAPPFNGGVSQPFMERPVNTDALAEQLMKVAMGSSEAGSTEVEQPDPLVFGQAQAEPEQVAQQPVVQEVAMQNSLPTGDLQEAVGRSFRREQEEASTGLFRRSRPS